VVLTLNLGKKKIPFGNFLFNHGHSFFLIFFVYLSVVWYTMSHV
jgi:hypothetical protein